MKTVITAICICSFVFSSLATASPSGSADKTYAKIRSKCDLGRLREGVACFTEYEKIQFTKLHKPYIGKLVSIYESFESYETLTFTVKEAGMVNLLVCKKFPGCSVEELQSNGWVVVDKVSMCHAGTLSTNELLIMEKKLPEGEYTFEKERGFGIRLIKM